MQILYTAEATATGGREGRSRSSDGNLDVELVPPGSDKQGTNPEELFAVGYAGCFHSALVIWARRMKLDAEGSSITARVSLRLEDDRSFGLAVELEADVPNIGPDEARELVANAHKTCPYSRATRGNIPVEVTIRDSARSSS
jgi:Ohr subfamily peroxiredoxin